VPWDAKTKDKSELYVQWLVNYLANSIVHPINLGVSVHEDVKLIINELFFLRKIIIFYH